MRLQPEEGNKLIRFNSSQSDETPLEKQESSVNQHLFWLSLEKYSLYIPPSKNIALVDL